MEPVFEECSFWTHYFVRPIQRIFSILRQDLKSLYISFCFIYSLLRFYRRKRIFKKTKDILKSQKKQTKESIIIVVLFLLLGLVLFIPSLDIRKTYYADGVLDVQRQEYQRFWFKEQPDDGLWNTTIIITMNITCQYDISFLSLNRSKLFKTYSFYGNLSLKLMYIGSASSIQINAYQQRFSFTFQLSAIPIN